MKDSTRNKLVEVCGKDLENSWRNTHVDAYDNIEKKKITSAFNVIDALLDLVYEERLDFSEEQAQHILQSENPASTLFSYFEGKEFAEEMVKEFEKISSYYFRHAAKKVAD